MKRSVIKVLVGADCPASRIGLKTMLKAPDIRVVGEADTDDKILGLVEGRNPRLVLLCMCRALDAKATELIRGIKARMPTTSVIVMRPNGFPGDVSRLIAAGCSGVMHSKTDRQQLLAAIRRVAHGECILASALLPDLFQKLIEQEAISSEGSRQPLTPPEREVLRLVAEGRTNRQIAERLRYSVGTVKDYVQKIIEKLEASDRTQAAVKAARLGLLE